MFRGDRSGLCFLWWFAPLRCAGRTADRVCARKRRPRADLSGGLPKQSDEGAPAALPRAHAHNDYWHDRPLWDAFAHGFRSVEVNVFLKDGQLLVGHAPDELRADRTLDSLYLRPLSGRFAEPAEAFPADDGPFTLLVDVKTEGRPPMRRCGACWPGMRVC